MIKKYFSQNLKRIISLKKLIFPRKQKNNIIFVYLSKILLILLVKILVFICPVYSEIKKDENHLNNYYYQQFHEIFEMIEQQYICTPEKQKMTN